MIRNVELCRGFVVRQEDAIFADASIYSIGAKTQEDVEKVARGLLHHSADFSASENRTLSIADPVLITSNEGSGTWGHWVVHNFPRIALARAVFPEVLVMIPDSYFGSHANFGALLSEIDFPRDQLLPSRNNVLYKLETAILVDYLYERNAVHPYCIDLFDSIAKKRPSSESILQPRIAIERTTKDKREIANHDEFSGLLSASGFQSDRLGARPLKEQIAVWTQTKIACSILGSDFASIVFGQTDGAVMAITPSWFGDDFFFDLAAARGMTWNELFCGRIDAERTPIINSSFRVDIDAAGKFLQASVGDGQ
jgi:capsular polysaccharide biosynthesis protein